MGLGTPADGGMRVPGRVYADRLLAEAVQHDQSLTQVANVAHLPGIIRYSMAMPDIHFGYGFPIGGVAAFSVDEGVVSPGGVGYDINCGCRLMTTDLDASDLRGQTRRVVDQLFRDVPAGVGASGAIAKLSRKQLEGLLTKGAAWAVEQGYGSAADLLHTEDGGALPGADPAAISERAYARGLDQVGTLGSGNHFLEIQVVDEIFDNASCRSLWPARGPGDRHGALRIARLRIPGVRGLPGVHGLGQPPVPHRTARPPAGLRPGDLTGGTGLLGGHGLRGQLRVGEPADDHASHRAGPSPCASPFAKGSRPAARVRRGAQHRQAGGP